MNKYIILFILSSAKLLSFNGFNQAFGTNFANRESLELMQEWLNDLHVPDPVENDTLPDPLHPINDNTPILDDNDDTFTESNVPSTSVSLEQISTSLSNIDTDDDVPTLLLILSELQTLNENQSDTGNIDSTTSDFSFKESSSIEGSFPTESVFTDISPTGSHPNLTFYVPKVVGGQTHTTIDIGDPKWSAVLNVAKIGLTALVVYGIFRNTWRLSATMLSA